MKLGRNTAKSRQSARLWVWSCLALAGLAWLLDVRVATLTRYGAAPASRPATVLAILAGGWACDLWGERTLPLPRQLGVFTHADAVLRRVTARYGATYDVLLSCFGQQSDAQVTWYAPTTGEKAQRGTYAAYAAAVKAEVARHPASLVVVVGHSFGGWLAIKTVAALQEEAGRAVDALVTIDAISPTLCRSAELPGYAWSMLKSLVTSGSYVAGSPAACQGAPQDIAASAEGLETVSPASLAAAGARFWDNYYQTDTRWLRGGVFAAAHRNTRVPFPFWHLNVHTEIDDHPLIWQRFAGQLAGILDANRSAAVIAKSGAPQLEGSSYALQP